MTAPHTVSTERSNVIAALRALAFVTLTLVMIPIHIVYMAKNPDDLFGMPLRFHRMLLKILGFKVRVHGEITTDRPVLFVSNHTSYLDIPVLGSLLPAAFIAKAEVADWPFFGYMAKIQHTVFIERKATRAEAQKNDLGALLTKGYNLILFPEGTSSDGQTVLPFKSSLFSIIENKESNGRSVTVQPISLICTQLDGLPMTRALRPFYSWYGDMTLVKHLWTVFKFGRFTVDVVFHPAVKPENFSNRKTLAAYCQQQVARGIEQGITGRMLPAKAAVAQLAPPH